MLIELILAIFFTLLQQDDNKKNCKHRIRTSVVASLPTGRSCSTTTILLARGAPKYLALTRVLVVSWPCMSLLTQQVTLSNKLDE